MLSVLICDPDADAVNLIQEEIANNYAVGIKSIRSFKNSASVLFYLEDNKKENVIAFIDIEFDRKRGIELAKAIKRIKESFVIIFMTSENKYNCEIYDVEHIFLLIKPLESKFLMKAMKKASETVTREKGQYIFAVTRTDVSMIQIKDIAYIEKEKRKIHVTDVNGKTYSFYSTFEAVENRLDSQFFRCHNSYIVNINRIVAVEGKNAVMYGGKSIPVSRVHLKALRETLLEGYSRADTGITHEDNEQTK